MGKMYSKLEAAKRNRNTCNWKKVRERMDTRVIENKYHYTIITIIIIIIINGKKSTRVSFPQHLFVYL